MIALLVETETNEGKAQSLIAPLKNEVVCYHRLSNGSRGRGQAWKQTCLDELPLDMVTCMPVAVPLTKTLRAWQSVRLQPLPSKP